MSGALNTTTCLIVEDEPAILRLVTVVLRDLGCETIPAADAESALNLMSDGTKPDVVLSDVRLPGMDGVQLAHEIKSDDKLHDTAVLLMSAYGEPGRHEGDGFLPKPFDIDGLIDFVAPYIEAA